MEDQLTGTAEHDIQHDFYDVETTNLHGLDSEPAPLTDEANELATVDINAEELPCDSSNLQLDVTPKEEPLLDVTSGPVQVLVGGSTNDSESVSADVMTLPVDTQQLVCTEDSVDIEGQFSVGHPSDDQDLSNEVSSEIVHQPDVTQSDNLLIADDKEEKQDITLVVASLNEGSEMQSISIEEVEEQGVATEEQEGLSASEEAELAEEPSSLAATSSQDGEEDVDANMTKLNRWESKIGNPGADPTWRCHLASIENPIVEIRRSHDRLISTMRFPILVRWHLYSESGLRSRTRFTNTSWAHN